MKEGEVKTVEIKQYKKPPVWIEACAYVGALGLFTAAVLNPANPIWVGIITGMLAFWNYQLFSILRQFVQHVNATEISKLLIELASQEIEDTEDGTISVSDGLINGDDDEEV